MLQAIKHIADGETFFVSGVKAKTQDGKMHQLPTLETLVKEGAQ